ncbi:MAG: hypothetical protein EB010_04515 [Acidimicrobiia bacterium]|nr:hypothetical protein [Acidimicrobiia bacterium]
MALRLIPRGAVCPECTVRRNDADGSRGRSYPTSERPERLGEGARGRAIERIGAAWRYGAERCNVDSWRRKSRTDECGLLSERPRIRGGTSTAPHAATTMIKTIVPICAASPRVRS